jgi:hypothetical protein
MKTIIINYRRELAELPELWYTDGTEEANEWGKSVYIAAEYFNKKYKFIGNDYYGHRNSQAFDTKEIAEEHHTYITPSEFLRLVYIPWREKTKLPTTYDELIYAMNQKQIRISSLISSIPHVYACSKLTNIMNFANDAFEKEATEWNVWSYGEVIEVNHKNNPIRFTSKAAAEWAYKTFPEIFKAYWNV